MKSRTAILIGLALLLAHPFSLQAQIPRTLSYQGIVTDAAGEIKPDGSYSFTFKLYDVSSGGTALWTESKTLSVKDGLFYTALGDQVVFPASLSFDKPYWLSLQVGGEAELAPRVALSSVGYSFNALRADTAEYALSAPAVGGGDITAVIAGSGLTGGGTSGDVTLSIDPDATLVVGRIFIYQEGSTPGSVFKIDNATNNSIVMDVESFGTGQVGRFRQSNSSSNVHAVSITNEGNGRALDVKAYGLSEGSSFEIHNSANINNAIYAQTDGSGNGIFARTRGSGYAGYFDGNIYTTGSLFEGSDIRWKHNITPLDDALNKVLSLRGVRFEWKREEYPDRNFKPGKQIGFIAQEVEEVLPELVRADQDDYKAVDYQKVTAVLVEAIKEQQKEIEALKAAVAELQAQSNVALQE